MLLSVHPPFYLCIRHSKGQYPPYLGCHAGKNLRGRPSSKGNRPLTAIDTIVARLQLVTVPVDREQALLARDGYRCCGRGMYAAGLNLGDCSSYALAKQPGEPLLFAGDDFSQTDVSCVRTL